MCLYAVTFENVGVNRPLGQELDSLLLSCLFLKDTDKFGADDFALFLRIGHPGQLRKEAVHGIHIDEIGIHLIAEYLDDLFGLALSQKSVIDVYAYELFTDGLNEQSGHD